MLTGRARIFRLVAIFTSAAIVGLGLAPATFAPATSALADTVPATGSNLPSTVSADALPTVQINGVVWSQVTIGNTVYATGDFTKARPAGTAVGDPAEAGRGGILAYDLVSGNLLPFSHSFNAAGRVIIASPDNSTIYVGGDFTTVDGQARGHIAAFTVATGALTSFAPTINATVLAMTASSSTVYAGGSFTIAAGVAHNRLAAFSRTNGSPASWAPSADNGTVTAIVLSPDQSTVVVAGRFTTLNGASRFGAGAVDSGAGALTLWNANFPIKDASANSSITSLKTDGNRIYLSGYTFNLGGNFEGTGAIDQFGNILWLNSCHGDTYDTQPIGDVNYSVSHAHDCSDVGGWEETTPRLWHRSLATTTAAGATCTLAHNNNPPYTDYFGTPCATLLDWYPDFAAGTFTGQIQAGWSVTGNSDYISAGGEFPTVNGVAQQGLARFAIRSLATNKLGPISMPTLIPNVLSPAPGQARVSWKATWDKDNENLTYRLFRNNGATPIYTVTTASTFYNMPNMGYLDTGIAPGTSMQYRLSITDPTGNVTNIGRSAAVLLSGSTYGPYAQDVLSDSAASYWRLGEAAGTQATDYAGYNDLTLGTTVTRGAAGAITGDSNAASSFGGSATGFGSSGTRTPAPDTYSTELWFKTTTILGGKLIGYGSANTGTSANNYDRQVYLDNAGHLLFGVNTTTSTILSSATYNDGLWHHVIATLSPAGMVLYADGRVIGRNASVTTGLPYTGYWRIGGDSLSGWKNAPASNFFAGSIDDVAVYPTALSLTQVQKHYTDSGRTLTGTVAPSDSFGKVIYADAPDIYYRMDEAAGTAATDSSGNNKTGTYFNGVTYATPTTVTTGAGSAVTFNGTSATLSDNTAATAPTVFSEEAWFKTSTTSGGKIIGFQSTASGSTGTFDRHVYLLDDGQLVFGTQTSASVTTRTTVTSPSSYNDGKWHHVVATMSSTGMALYVDGAPAGSATQASAQSYSGFWRIGGGSTWGGTSGFLAGAIDEAAIYSYELTPAQVASHWNASHASDQPPVASFTSSVSNLTIAFDGSGSSDPDGTVAGYAWDFGDGTTGTGATASHTYAVPGSYPVTLTVTDNAGATSTAARTVATNVPPVAVFTSSMSNLTVSVDGTSSTDADGTIAGYAWNFGDGTTGTGATASHTYASPGTHPLTLTVTDDSGATNSASRSVITNQPPVATFTTTQDNLTLSVDASGSTDSDGLIASYAWDFGDGATAGGRTASHTYAGAASYPVTLVVTDTSGATSTATRTVAVSVNQSPVAVFTPTVNGGSVAFNGSGSSDADGTIAGYAWNFGDSSTGTGASTTHTYTPEIRLI